MVKFHRDKYFIQITKNHIITQVLHDSWMRKFKVGVKPSIANEIKAVVWVTLTNVTIR